MDATIKSLYTMVEIIAVCAIIMILAGIGAGGYNVARGIMAKSITEATLGKLRLALESYKSKYGYYPHSTGSAMAFHLDIIDPTQHPAGNPANNLNQFLDYARMQRDECVREIIKVIPNPPYDDIIVYAYYVKDGYTRKTNPIEKTPIDAIPYSPIKYRSPGVRNPTSFDLYSAGPSGDFSKTGDNIYAK